MTHYWALCVRPVQCGLQSRCFTSRGAAAGWAGQHKRKHGKERLAPGARAAIAIRTHEAVAEDALCLEGEAVPA